MTAATLGLSGCVPDEESPPEWAALLSGHACAADAVEALSAVGARERALRGPPTIGSGDTYRVPTSTIGAWVRIERRAGARPTLSLVRASGVQELVFAEGCTPSWRDVSAAATGVVAETPEGGQLVRGPADAFTDVDLARALEANAELPATVVYVWSPHMSLSVDGYAEITQACEALGLALVPVLFPDGDIDFARAEAARAGIPTEALRETRSVELAFRDALVHAPSIVVFSRRGVSPVLPGYRDATGYRRFLDDFLAGG